MAKLTGPGDIVVDILTGDLGRIVERYSQNYHPYYADFRIRFVGDLYRIVRLRHIRKSLPAEARAYCQWSARWLAGRAALAEDGQ